MAELAEVLLLGRAVFAFGREVAVGRFNAPMRPCVPAVGLEALLGLAVVPLALGLLMLLVAVGRLLLNDPDEVRPLALLPLKLLRPSVGTR